MRSELEQLLARAERSSSGAYRLEPGALGRDVAALRALELIYRCYSSDGEQLEQLTPAGELERARILEPAQTRARPLPAQLDMDGGSHELARPTERLRLFEPAPAQLDGQCFLTDAELER